MPGDGYFEPALLERVAGLQLAIDLRNRIIHGYNAVDDEIVYLTVAEDLDELKAELVELLATRGRAMGEGRANAKLFATCGAFHPCAYYPYAY